MAASLMSIVRAGWALSKSALKPYSYCLTQGVRNPDIGSRLPTSSQFQSRTIFSALPSSHNLGLVFSLNGIANRLSLQPKTPNIQQIRTKIKCSLKKGKPKSVKAVTERFYRLNWGIWIRTHAGRAKRLWKKSAERKHRLRQHVFCNKQQSKLLDKMVTAFWKRPKFFVDDPYEPYHKRHNFPTYFPEKRPFYP